MLNFGLGIAALASDVRLRLAKSCTRELEPTPPAAYTEQVPFETDDRILSVRLPTQSRIQQSPKRKMAVLSANLMIDRNSTQPV